MKIIFFAFSLLILFSSCDDGDKNIVGDNDQDVNDEDIGDTGNTGNTGNTGDTGDTASDADKGNTGNTANDSDADTANTGNPVEMVLIPAGSFWMGSSESELGRVSDEVLHYVELTKGFYMDTTEVTQGSFNSLMEYNPSYFLSCGDDCPVEWVSWNEALVYANARSKEEGLEECFDCTKTAPYFECSLKSKFTKPQDCLGYRLPTESEWEYAVKAETDTAFYSGDITQTQKSPLDPNLDAIGWYGGNSGASYEGAFGCTDWYEGSINCGTQPVGGKLVNSFGLYDMSGNVWEWTMDWIGDYPAGTEESPSVDPTGVESGSNRVQRGGSWDNFAYSCRSAYRLNLTPGSRSSDLGFRLVRTK